MFHVELVVARLRQLCSTWNVLHVTPSKLETAIAGKCRTLWAGESFSFCRNPSANESVLRNRIRTA
jgi:hypothetical protein